MKRRNINPNIKITEVAKRLQLLFMIVVFLFVVLILRLAYMQVANQDFYLKKLNASTVYRVKTSTPRGQIYDATGLPLVENEAKEVVAFTRSRTMTAEEIKNLAKSLSQFVPLVDEVPTEREKRDYYLADQAIYREAVSKLPKEKRYDHFGNTLSESVIYQNVVDAVSENKVAYPDDELKIISLFSQMNRASVFNTVNLRTGDLSDQAIALIAAKRQDLSGVSVRTDWSRKKEDNSLSAIIGTVSSEKTGLPAEEADSYLKKGYSFNDRVGTSYLEKTYESILQGIPTVKEITLNKDGGVEQEKEVSKGKKGQNLKLTVDLKFQEGTEKILESYFKQELGNGGAAYSEGVYAVALNPNTGAVLALAGLRQDDENDELQKDSLGTLTKAFTPGSVVKGATLVSGWQNGVISGNETRYDQPITFSGDSSAIESWFTSGAMPITAVQALEYSSNTYMVQVALGLMGIDYHVGMTLLTDNYKTAMSKLRQTYAQFGLGVLTGIDLPEESTGYIPKEFTIGNVLTESFGQFDTYTPLQLAQYVSTVANGGRRIAPHLVSEIYEPNKQDGMGDLTKTIEPKVLDEVAVSADDMSLVQQGFYQVANGGSSLTTGSKISAGASVSISAKTGTAEVYAKSSDGSSVYTSNLNVVAYAPSTNPQIAVSVVFPHETDLRGDVSQHIVRDIINLYHSLYPMN